MLITAGGTGDRQMKFLVSSFRRRLTAMSLEPLPPSTPDSFAAYIKTEIERWAVIVKNSGAELE